MKKFILFIAVLTASIGSGYAEELIIINQSQSEGQSADIPFSITISGPQKVQMYYPVTCFYANNNEQPAAWSKWTVNSISKISFQTISNIPDAVSTVLAQSNISNISIKFAHQNALPSQSQIIDLGNDCESAVNPNYNYSNTNVEFSFERVNLGKFDLNSGYIVIEICLTVNTPLSSTQESISGDIWSVANNKNYFSCWDSNSQSNSSCYSLPYTQLNCVRKYYGVLGDDNHEYNVYTDDGGISAHAALTKYNLAQSNSNEKFFTYCATADDVTYKTNLELHKLNVYIVPEKMRCSLRNYEIFVKGIEGKPFYNDNIKISDKKAFVLPSCLTYIGDPNATDNECFSMAYYTNPDADSVAIILTPNNNALPELNGLNFTSFINKLNGKDIVNLYITVPYSNNVCSLPNSWTDEIKGLFKKTGYVSYMYEVKAVNAYDFNHTFKININQQENPIYISSLPLGNQALKVGLTGKHYASNDGSNHYYSKITGVTATSGINVSGLHSAEISSDLTKDADYTIQTDNDDRLEYENGEGRFTLSTDNSSLGGHKIFYKSKALTFKLYEDKDQDNKVKYDNDKVPYWYLIGNANTDNITTDAAIHVEKEIISDHYRYFSLPFDCPINAIEVHKIVDGVVQTEAIDLLEQEPDNWNNLGSDYYVINKYIGQKTDNEGLPNYDWISKSSDGGILKKNQGYAFALVSKEIDENGNEVPIKAIITFKSRDDANAEEYILKSWNFEETISVTLRENEKNYQPQNKNWFMIGNPYFHYINANTLYGTAGDNARIKYITLINDDVNESVTHYWVNNEDHYVSAVTGEHEKSHLTLEQIKPFQAFFVQVKDNNTSITFEQGTTIAQQPYTGPSKDQQNTLSAQPDIQEHLSVKVMGQDSLSDHTTIINDENRDEHFQLMDDLAKMMNPWIQVYTWYDSVPCAFKELPLRADSSMAIPLGVKAIAAGNYTFSLDTSLTVFYGAVMLHDKQANQYYPLNEEGVQISLNEGEENNRFEIVVVPSEIPADVENVETSETLDAYVHDGRLFVENIADGSTLSIYDISGRLLYNAPASGDFNYQFNTHGVYMVVLRGNTTGSIKVVY